MTYEKDKTRDDLTQIVADQRSSLQLLDQLIIEKPEMADDLTEMRERTLKNLIGLKEIAERTREEFDENTSEN